MADYVAEFGVVALFAILAVQSMGIGGPPGKTALVVAALLAASGEFRIWHVLVAAVAGIFVGGTTGYWIARKGGRSLLARPRLERRARRPLALAERFYAVHGAKAVFLGRFFPGIKVVVAPAAGIFGMPWRQFALWHAAGAVAFTLLFGLGTYYVGESAIELAERYGVWALLPITIVGVAVWAAWRAVVARRAAAALAGEPVPREEDMPVAPEEPVEVR